MPLAVLFIALRAALRVGRRNPDFSMFLVLPARFSFGAVLRKAFPQNSLKQWDYFYTSITPRKSSGNVSTVLARLWVTCGENLDTYEYTDYSYKLTVIKEV